ncbi:hypothetical protein AHAS_Ahas11G0103000 [Arachis hypogaea]
MKDDYVYQVSDEDPAKEQEQQSKETLVVLQSEQEAPVDVCPQEPKKQGVTGSLTTTSSVIEEFFKDDNVYEVHCKFGFRQRENERPSFSLGISPPVSQPTQPSQESVSELEILAEAVVDAGVIVALKFAEATSSEPTLPAAEVFKTPGKKIKISKELIKSVIIG